MGVQWWLVGWRSTSRHFVNSISLSFPLPAHELNSHIDRDPSLRVCFLSRLSIRNFLERASKRSLCKLHKMNWKKNKRELVNNRRRWFLSSFRDVLYVFMLQGLLISCNQMSAEYLFMTDKLYDVKYDTGDKVIQCGRHNDIFKLWLQWRAKVNGRSNRTKLENVDRSYSNLEEIILTYFVK